MGGGDKKKEKLGEGSKDKGRGQRLVEFPRWRASYPMIILPRR